MALFYLTQKTQKSQKLRKHRNFQFLSLSLFSVLFLKHLAIIIKKERYQESPMALLLVKNFNRQINVSHLLASFFIIKVRGKSDCTTI